MFFAYQTPLWFAVIWRAVCRILQSKRPSFAIQKTAFCKVLIYKPLWRRWLSLARAWQNVRRQPSLLLNSAHATAVAMATFRLSMPPESE